jgi:hypothetical protein
MLESICARCGKEFLAWRDGSKWCSVKCRWGSWKADNPPPSSERVCRNCGTVFTSSDLRKKYCSQKCNYSFHNSKRPTTKELKRECPQCKERFVPMQKRGVGKTYCSSKCQRKFNYDKNHKTILDRQRAWVKKNKWDGNWQGAIEGSSYTCGLCKKQIYPSQWTKSRRLEVHHRDGSGEMDNKNHDLPNLLTLCTSCHQEFHVKIGLVFINGEYFVRGKIFGLLGLTSVKATT